MAMKTLTAVDIKTVFAGAILILCMHARAQVSVLTRQNDLARSGWYNRETALNPSNVNARQFGKIFSVPVDGKVFTQVLILSNVCVRKAALVSRLEFLVLLKSRTEVHYIFTFWCGSKVQFLFQF